MKSNKKNKIFSQKLLWKISLPFLFFIMLLGIGFTSTILLTESQKHDALIMNVIGRQRLLTQMMTKGSLMLYYRNEEIEYKRLTEYVTLFNQTHLGLWKGGTITINPETKETKKILGVSDSKLLHEFNKINQKWFPFQSNLLDFLNTKNKENLEYILAHNMALKDNIDKATLLFQANARYKVTLTRFIQTILIILSFLIMIFLFYLIQRRLIQPINSIQSFSATLALGNGDLQQRFPILSHDEIGALADSQNKFIEFMSSMIVSLSEYSQKLKKNSDSLEFYVDQLSRIAEEQASETEESSTALEQATSSVEMIADHSKKQNETFEKNIVDINEFHVSAETILASIVSLRDLTDLSAMRAANGETQIKEMHQAMEDIRQVFSTITNFVNTIVDISDQTNLLSLNAAIEAARAGDTGKGFAVVADEISKLADKSVKSVKEITNLIRTTDDAVNHGQRIAKDTGTSVAEIFQAIDGMKGFTSSTATLVQNEREKMQHVIERIKLATGLSQQIASAIDEQKHAMNEINETIFRLAEKSQKMSNIATTIEGKSASVEQISSQISNLINKFTV